ncbi:polysaccharide biosynthesis protein, partial [Candidatus Poribacteria bacterium]|nr:polysaccharide biosynthesis protein [Candidatus Poribacteria bacterium]
MLDNNNFKYDVVTNAYKASFPDGLDFEIFNFQTLKKTFKLAKKPDDKEH